MDLYVEFSSRTKNEFLIQKYNQWEILGNNLAVIMISCCRLDHPKQIHFYKSFIVSLFVSVSYEKMKQKIFKEKC